MEVIYEIEDGYIGKSRPQTVKIDDDELAECETLEEKKELIESYVQEDFDQNISWCITDYGDLDEEIKGDK